MSNSRPNNLSVNNNKEEQHSYEAARVANSQNPFLNLPYDALNYGIAPFLDSQSLAAFSRSSIYANSWAQPLLKKRAIKKLFAHILGGEMDAVIQMLTASPRLALEKYQAEAAEEKVIINKAGQRILAEGKTAYRLALGEEDTEMAALCKDCILNVASAEEANAQYCEQFPAGWEAAEQGKWHFIFNQLERLTLAIKNAAQDDITFDPHLPEDQGRLTVRDVAVARELAQYRTLLDGMLNEPVTTGRHFNPNLLLQVFTTYDDYFRDYCGGRDYLAPRAVVLWQQGVGYTQRFMPSNYAQAFCAGLDNTARNLRQGTPHSRSLELEILRCFPFAWEHINLYPLSTSRLGFDFAIYLGDFATPKAKGMPFFGGRTAPDFQNLCQSKTAVMQSLLSQPPVDSSATEAPPNSCILS